MFIVISCDKIYGPFRTADAAAKWATSWKGWVIDASKWRIQMLMKPGKAPKIK